MKVFAWNDVSPEDGCTAVRVAVAAESWTAVAKLARAAGFSCTTVKDLRREGIVSHYEEEVAAATALPGRLVWADYTRATHPQWRTVSD